MIDNGEWWTMVDDRQWRMTIGYDRQWEMIDKGEWYTNRNERQSEIADSVDSAEWHSMGNDRQCEW